MATNITYFVTKETISNYGFINGNVNSQIINPAIIRCQNRFVKPTIGADFYKHIKSGITSNSLTAKEEELLDEYIRPYLTVEVEIKVARELNNQLRAKATGHGTDPNFQKQDESQQFRSINDKKNDALHYRNEMIDFVCKNKADFPLACLPANKKTKNFNIITNYSQHNRSKF